MSAITTIVVAGMILAVVVGAVLGDRLIARIHRRTVALVEVLWT